MENQNTNQSLFDLNINENVKTQLRGAAVWGGIAALLSLIGTILGFIRSIMERNNPRVEYRYEGFSQTRVDAARSGSLIWGVIWLIIIILLFYFLNRFSTLTKNGLDSNNQELVNNGLGSLSSYFVTIGILLIIFLAFLALVIAFGVSMGAR